MGSGIRTKDDICDLDDGVYFFRKPDVSAATLQGWVWDAVNGYTDTTPEYRKKCIRNIFSGDYEIDMPVYYKIDGEDYQLAVKNVGWESSDPKAIVDWFNEQKDKNGIILRIVKKHKAWGDHKRNRMPNGLAMTILVCNAAKKIVLNERDDITMRDILNEIHKTLNVNFTCVVPAVPNDDLFADYDTDRKDDFMNALKAFLDDANAALKETNELKSSRLWRKHLGNRFPEGKDEDTEKVDAAIVTGAKSSRPWAAQK